MLNMKPRCPLSPSERQERAMKLAMGVIVASGCATQARGRRRFCKQVCGVDFGDISQFVAEVWTRELVKRFCLERRSKKLHIE